MAQCCHAAVLRQPEARAQLVEHRPQGALLGRANQRHARELPCQIFRAPSAEREEDARQPVAIAQLMHERVQPVGLEEAPLMVPGRVMGRARLLAVADVLELLLVADDLVVALKQHGQRDRPVRLLHDVDRPLMDVADPLGDLLDVGHRGAEGQQVHVDRSKEDRLLPDRAPFLVVEVVDLIEDDPGVAREPLDVLQQRVAVDLGRHDHQRRGGVDRDIAREDADSRVAVARGEVAEFLVAQRLDRGGVDDALMARERALDDIVRQDGFAGAGRCGDKHGAVALDRLDRLLLERIILKRMDRRIAHVMPPAHHSTTEVHRDTETWHMSSSVLLRLLCASVVSTAV